MTKRGSSLLLAGVSALALSAFTAGAEANVITGSLWENQTAAAGDATLANIPGTPANVTFTVNSPLNFNSNGSSDYTIGSWLATGGATINTGAGESGNTMNNTIIEFTGTVSVTHGETFTVEHDDGLTLKIGSDTVIDAPGPTSATLTTETYTGASGNETFTLVYGECCGPPAVLNVSLPLTAAPEPGSLPLLGTGLLLLGLGAAWRYRQNIS